MSARPFVPRLADEELDLLLSRSLDGDLSPEETRVLETLLAHDPAALKRKEDLARVVAEAAALPAPAPPFALATRVNSTVAEKGSRGGLLARRFGFYPPPGMAIGAMALLAIVAVAIGVLKPAPRADGPVDVFFMDAKSDAKSAPQQASREAPKAKAKEPARSQVGGAAGQRAEAPAAPAAVVASADESMPKDAGRLDAEKKLAAPASAANEPALEARQRPLAKAETDAYAAPAARAGAPAVASAPAPPPPAAVPQAAGAVAPNARANAVPARAWSVAVKGEGARRWMLRRAPEGRPASASSLTSSFRITLDTDGRVTSVRALDARPVQPALLAFVRGLVFARVETTRSLADERAKAAERLDAPAERAAEPPSEIDVEVSTR